MRAPSQFCLTAAAGNLDPLVRRSVEYFFERCSELCSVEWQPEVGPSNPPARPIERSRIATRQVDTELGLRPGWQRCAQPPPTNQASRRQCHDSGCVLVPHRIYLVNSYAAGSAVRRRRRMASVDQGQLKLLVPVLSMK